MNRRLAAVKRSIQATGRKVHVLPEPGPEGEPGDSVITASLSLPADAEIQRALAGTDGPFSAVLYLAGNLLYMAVPNIDRLHDDALDEASIARRDLLLALSFDSGLVRGSVDAADGEVRLISALPGPLAASWAPDALRELEIALADYLRLVGSQNLDTDARSNPYLQ